MPEESEPAQNDVPPAETPVPAPAPPTPPDVPAEAPAPAPAPPTPPPDLECITEWEEKLEKIREYVAGELRESRQWYVTAVGKRKNIAGRLRLWAILLAAFAGLIPLVQQIFVANPIPFFIGNKELGKLLLAQGWSAIFLALAATLILVDRFFGYSTAWMRFTDAATQLETAIATFKLNWERGKSLWTDCKPSPEQITSQIDIAQKCMMDARGIVKKETDLWIQEFTSILTQYNNPNAMKTSLSEGSGTTPKPPPASGGTQPPTP